MSRHRNVRSMNYDDERYDDEDDYSRSLEDSYCISPSTAAQFTWNRERNINFASYMGVEDVINEVEESEEQDSSFHDSLNDSSSQARLKLNDTDQARLNSCLDEIRTVIGENVSESVVVDVIIKNQFNIEKSLNEILTQQEAPKSQREPRNRTNRSQDDNNDDNELNRLLSEIQSLESLPKSTFHVPELLRFKSNPGQEGEDSTKIDLLSQSPGNNVNDKNTGLIMTNDQSLKDSRNKTSSHQLQSDKSLSLSRKKDNKSTPPIHISSRQERKENVNSGSSPSLTDLVKQSQSSPNNNKGLLSTLAGGKLSGLSLSDGHHLSEKSVPKGGLGMKTTDTGKVSLADLAKQHKGSDSGRDGPGMKKMYSGSSSCNSNSLTQGSGISLASMAQQHSTQNKDKDSSQAGLLGKNQKLSLVGLNKKEGIVTKPSSSSTISLSDLVNQHKSNVQSLGILKMEAKSNLGKRDFKDYDLRLSKVGSVGAGKGDKQMTAPKNPAVAFEKLSLESCLKSSKPNSVPSVSRKQDDSPDDPLNSLFIQQFSVESCYSSEHSGPVSISMDAPDSSLVTTAPSTSGFALCQTFHRTNPPRRKRKFPHFECQKQVKKIKILYPDKKLHQLRSFNFLTLSPDDIVKNKQKTAFRRSDKEFQLGFSSGSS